MKIEHFQTLLDETERFLGFRYTSLASQSCNELFTCKFPTVFKLFRHRVNASSNFATVTFFTVFKMCRHRVNAVLVLNIGHRLHYISPSNLRSLLLLLSLHLRDLCPYASKQGLIRPSPPRSRRDQSDHYFLNMVNPRAYC